MRSLQCLCEMNVVAEFKKFDVHRVQRGLVTRECVEAVLASEGIVGTDLVFRVNQFMCHDQDCDGIVLFPMCVSVGHLQGTVRLDAAARAARMANLDTHEV